MSHRNNQTRVDLVTRDLEWIPRGGNPLLLVSSPRDPLGIPSHQNMYLFIRAIGSPVFTVCMSWFLCLFSYCIFNPDCSYVLCLSFLSQRIATYHSKQMYNTSPDVGMDLITLATR
jgi:hypothetical protein